MNFAKKLFNVLRPSNFLGYWDITALIKPLKIALLALIAAGLVLIVFLNWSEIKIMTGYNDFMDWLEQPTEQQEYRNEVGCQTDVYQLQRDDAWCTINLYGLSEEQFAENVDSTTILRLCDVAQTSEVIAYSDGYGNVIEARIPHHEMKVGDVVCSGGEYYINEDCGKQNDFIWIDVGFINK